MVYGIDDICWQYSGHSIEIPEHRLQCYSPHYDICVTVLPVEATILNLISSITMYEFFHGDFSNIDIDHWRILRDIPSSP